MDRKRAKESEVVIYVGTRKLVALAGVMRNGEPRITGLTVQMNPEGFKNGLVTNLERAASSLEMLVNSLFPRDAKDESSPSTDIAAYIVLGNPKIKTYTFSSSQYFQGMRKIISTQDIQSVVDQTRSVATLPLSESVLQILPVAFLVNDLEGVSDPTGLEAQRLGVCLKIFTLDSQDFGNLTRALEAAEIEVRDYFPKMLTASEAILDKREKEEGSLLIDIAAEATFFSVWKKGELVNTRVIDIGGRYLSSQLANLWEIELEDAERVKEKYGSLDRNSQFNDELIPIVERNGKQSQPVNRKVFQEKFLDLSKKWLEQILSAGDQFAKEEKLFHPHLIFTGGATCLDSFLEFVQKEFSREGRIGLTHRIDAANEMLVDPSLTAALGMYSWLAYAGNEKAHLLEPKGIVRKTFSAARNWFSTYF